MPLNLLLLKTHKCQYIYFIPCTCVLHTEIPSSSTWYLDTNAVPYCKLLNIKPNKYVLVKTRMYSHNKRVNHNWWSTQPLPFSARIVHEYYTRSAVNGTLRKSFFLFYDVVAVLLELLVLFRSMPLSIIYLPH